MTTPRPRPTYLQHGRRHAPTGSDPIPGLGVGPFCAVSIEHSNPDIHASGNYGMKWDTIWDNRSNVITAPPDGMGLTITADGATQNIVAEEAGYWAFEYTLNFTADATFMAIIELPSSGSGIGLPGTFGPVNPPHVSRYHATTLWPVDEGEIFDLNINTITAATANPYNLAYVFMGITRLG